MFKLIGLWITVFSVSAFGFGEDFELNFLLAKERHRIVTGSDGKESVLDPYEFKAGVAYYSGRAQRFSYSAPALTVSYYLMDWLQVEGHAVGPASPADIFSGVSVTVEHPILEFGNLKDGDPFFTVSAVGRLFVDYVFEGTDRNTGAADHGVAGNLVGGLKAELCPNDRFVVSGWALALGPEHLGIYRSEHSVLLGTAIEYRF